MPAQFTPPPVPAQSETRFLTETGFLRSGTRLHRVLASVVPLLVLAVGVVLDARATAQDDDELARGLLAEYSTAGPTLQRVDHDVAFVWDAAAPDPRLPDGPFSARWTGQLLLREPSSLTFHAFVQGKVVLRVDGELVLAGESPRPGWISGNPVALTPGFRDLAAAYERTAAEGRLHLYWSSARFPLEPLPHHLLFHEDGQPELGRQERGRLLFDAHRCNRCHAAPSELPSPPGPDLTHLTTGLSAGWLLEKLQHIRADAATSRMPDFGFSADDARALAAFLAGESRPADLLDVPRIKIDGKNRPPDGDLLIHSLGCLACHRVGELGESSPFGGPDLTHVGRKRSRAWLFTQLAEPARVNAHALMPVFELSLIERAQIAAALSRLGGNEDASFNAAQLADRDLARRGRELFDVARCAACHRLGDRQLAAPQFPDLTGDIKDWSNTCLAESPDRDKLRPAYPHADREALRAYLQSRPAPVSTASLSARGRLVLERRNCLACHERDGATGIVPTAGRAATDDPRPAGQSQALIPPNLTAVGDKLLDAALREAVRGAQKPRLPWLSVRMPRFEHAPADHDALVAHLVAHDRIPDGAPASLPLPIPDAGDTGAATLLAGRTLVGATGFSCIACHEFGDYVPPNVSIATHGCDLLGLSRRMRPEYFLRWTHSPLRIVPGMEMPSYERAVPGVLDGKAETQLAALWQALNDPRFTAPTNPTAVEQLITVLPGERPRVIRDVFTVSEENGGGYVPRALAVGFDNGHGVLFDLDRAAVRDWTFGDFARQRTQGKSWFWDLAGVLAAGGLGDDSDLSLRSRRSGQWFPLVAEPGQHAQLATYGSREADPSGTPIQLDYTVPLPDPAGGGTLRVVETWRSWSDDSASGWTRELHATAIPDGFDLCLRRERRLSSPLQPELSVLVPANAAWTGCDDAHDATPFASVSTDADLTLLYSCRVPRAAGAEKARPEWPHNDAPVTTVPGFDGVRLNLPASIMPTSLGWMPDGTLVFTSLKGHVYLARDTDGNGVEDALATFEEGLAAPFGLLPDGESLLVAHKPELLRLRDVDGDGRCDERHIVADGWGYTHDYHDWTTGPVRDRAGNLFLAISSDYQQAQRDRATTKWRGKLLRLDTRGHLEPVAHELRFPIGIALDDQDRLFVSDQQGVQNTFNEIDHIIEGGRYGVPALTDPPREGDETRAAIQVPHPWTRSVNGIFFLPGSQDSRDDNYKSKIDAFSGHGIGCEYNGRLLIRFTLQEVGGALQGAVYEFTHPTWDDESRTFLGPICGGVSPAGDIYVGSIFDSGWLGGRNTGEIVRLRPNGDLSNGIRELRAVPGGFELRFVHPVDPVAAARPESYTVSGYTRVWEGSYATPDSGRYAAQIRSVNVSADATVVTLHTDDLRERYVYDVACGAIGAGDSPPLFPASAAYTMNRVPR